MSLINNHANNGLITKIWGPHLWKSLHYISFGYPIDPTDDDKKNYKNFFTSLSYVLPCKYCRDSYQYFINSEPTEINDNIFTNRDTLTEWLYHLHERVNQKLGVNYNVSYQEVQEKYESCRVNCLMSLELKAKSYQNDAKKDCPIISLKFAKAIKEYAILRKVDFDKIEYYNKLKNNKKSTEWNNRNMKCNEIIFNMKCHGVSSIESEGKYEGLPTIEELKLISMLCSNLSKYELINITHKLNNPVHFKYKLINSKNKNI